MVYRLSGGPLCAKVLGSPVFRPGPHLPGLVALVAGEPPSWSVRSLRLPAPEKYRQDAAGGTREPMTEVPPTSAELPFQHGHGQVNGGAMPWPGGPHAGW